jgi:hypothetical protein
MLPKSHLTSLAATSGCDLACQGLGRGLCVAEDDHFLSTKHIMRNRDERSSHQLCHSSLGKLGKNHNGCLRMAACGKEKSLHLLSHSDLGTLCNARKRATGAMHGRGQLVQCAGECVQCTEEGNWCSALVNAGSSRPRLRKTRPELFCTTLPRIT